MMPVVKIITAPKYLLLSIAVSLMVIGFAAWLPNLHLITKTMTNSTMTLWQKTNLLTGLLGSLQTNFTPLSRIVTFASATLAGVQISLLMYYLKQTARVQKSLGMSALGMATSMLGVGCASCGSVVLTSLIGFGSATAVLGFLPFRGQEFGFIGIGILLFAINLTVKKINQPYVCEIRREK
ncbi:hypothetical protein A2872_04195 [Candidatus Gottesmanbacteria bacterium RIFCSPHIGHO2_01_FULL_42_12]|uniref:Uncharacterized protein n=1 Tax=Candidatus Gottesmanbacteria bacterium RIFCSPHIGHO2_01_FULL_42_12 TaxID=1798377 RepID=A0A1F5Z1E0_9BACT|nr:MAG: hypothetical protein A2872_04195 [Candidatus Gottesmanbacteria bacterium RIFCSPHIGHO2_01_FULL_42_12]